MTIYINDFSIVSALGSGKDETIESLKNERFDCSKELSLSDGSVIRAMQVDLRKDKSKMVLKREYDSRNNRLLLSSYYQVKDSFEKMRENIPNDRIGVVLGTTSSGIGESQSLNYKKDIARDEYIYNLQVMSNGSDFISDYLKIKGPSYTISSACSSSGRAFYEARALIDNDECDLVLVGGVDSINELSMSGFNALGATTNKLCLPFSSDQFGINIGEGSALFILSKKPSPYVFMGAGESSDGYHISSPEPSGAGAKAVIFECLKDSNLELDSVSYINLHGTGTQKNDEMESAVINELFKDECNYSSTKSLTGHTLGAASAVEAALSLLILENKILNRNTCIKRHKFKQLNSNSSYGLSMSYGFGGNNICLAFGVNNER